METIINGFKTNRAFAVTSVLVLCLLLIAIAAPVIAPYDPTHAAMKDAFLEPGAQHLFGTDKLGRDCFSRVLYGARASLTGVLVLVASVFVVGTTMGVVSGYFGGKVDMVIMRISDMMISFPGMILAIAIAGIMGGSLVNAVFALTIVSWTKYARLSRSMVLKVKRRDFVEAAIVNGGTPGHILWVHILPNILPMMVITALRRYRHGALRGFLRSYQNSTGTQHDADGAVGILPFAVAAGAALGQQRTVAGLAGLYAVSVNNTFILFVLFEKKICISNPFVTNLLQIMRINAIINS